MARLYALMYCFENSVRDLITRRLEERYGADWWAGNIPSKIKTHAATRLKDARQNSWLEGQDRGLLSYVDFGHLADIVIHNWEDFGDLIPTQHWVRQRFDELEKARNFVAHNRLLLPGEFQRVEMYINDWNKIIGL